MSDVLKTCDEIREIAYAIHRCFGYGHLEKVYENALVNRLTKAGSKVEQQVPITVSDEDGTIVGDYVADLVINGELLIELKAVDAICGAHTAQVLGYLRATGLKHALLINFGGPHFQIKKVLRGISWWSNRFPCDRIRRGDCNEFRKSNESDGDIAKYDRCWPGKARPSRAESYMHSVCRQALFVAFPTFVAIKIYEEP